MKFKTLKSFLNEEINPTFRVGIFEIRKLSEIEFLRLIKVIVEKYNNILPQTSVIIKEKIDGVSLRFGLDENNRLFLETSYSKPIFDLESYKNFLSKKIEKPEENIIYNLVKDIKNEFEKNNNLLSILKKYNKNGIKIICECLYNKMAKEVDENKLRFITVSYNKDKLGRFATFILFDVIDNEGKSYLNSEEIIEELERISNNDLKFIRLKKINNSDLDLTILFSRWKNLISDIDFIIEILKKKNKNEVNIRRVLKEIINDFREKFCKFLIDKIEHKGILGDEYEGLVFDFLELGKKYKLWTDQFIKKFEIKKQEFRK